MRLYKGYGVAWNSLSQLDRYGRKFDGAEIIKVKLSITEIEDVKAKEKYEAKKEIEEKENLLKLANNRLIYQELRDRGIIDELGNITDKYRSIIHSW